MVRATRTFFMHTFTTACLQKDLFLYYLEKWCFVHHDPPSDTYHPTNPRLSHRLYSRVDRVLLTDLWCIRRSWGNKISDLVTRTITSGLQSGRFEFWSRCVNLVNVDFSDIRNSCNVAFGQCVRFIVCSEFEPDLPRAFGVLNGMVRIPELCPIGGNKDAT